MARRCSRDKKHEIVRASSDAVIVAGPGPSRSRVVKVNVSEIEKLTGAARILSVATDPTSVSVHSTIQRESSGYQRTSPAAAARANAPAAMTAQGYAARIDNLGIDTQGRSDIPPTVGYRQQRSE